MDDAGIGTRVKQFITDHVDSVMQLELILLLAGSAEKLWSEHELAQQLRVDPVWTEAQLRALVAMGISVASGDSQVLYRYEPRTPELSATIIELAQAYADRRVSVIGLIFSKPTDKLRSFADAFRIRKDRSDG